ncbi:MAG: hypothetical protein OIF56_02745 [Cohaesibacter sp.]|nr:hypothetical protein [Cohaesibacter sp.]MCV6601100.1 hypothetical protein [Cohaesibacter sp.]
MASLKQWTMVALALFCLVGGLITIWLPIPTGLPLLALGLFLLIAYSSASRKWIRRLRKVWPFVDHQMVWIEGRVGKSVGRVLKTTRPLLHRKKTSNCSRG